MHTPAPPSEPRPSDGLPAETRLARVPWGALPALAPSLDAPLAAVLAGAPAERALDRFLRAGRDLSADARAAAAEAVFGVGLWRRRLRWHAGEHAPPRLLLAALLRDVAGVPDAAALAGLPPAALPAPRPPPPDLPRRLSLPDWLAAEIARAAGGEPGEPSGLEAWALAGALSTPGPVTFRANALLATREALAPRLAAEGVPARPGALARHALLAAAPRPNVLGLAAFREGLLEVQDEGSQLAGALAGARPGEEVLDLCAGAGGKTLLLAAEVGPAGRVHAADPDASRLARLAVRSRRAAASGIVTLHGPAAPAGLLADRVLVDAPCSELGPLRRGPDLRWRLDPAALAPLPALQLGILSRAAAHVRPGGTLAYVTCTFRREEDEDVALAFETAHPGFDRAEPAAALPAGARTPEGFVRLLPHLHGTDGFFVATWRRRAGRAAAHRRR
jgi:16S rRNA (cytosine967-C5)-methyltransferase